MLPDGRGIISKTLAERGLRVETGSGTSLQLGECFAKGGEATIWTLSHQLDCVAKIFHAPTEAKEQKIATMVAHPPAELHQLSVAWPEDVLFQKGSFIGYLMPRIRDAVPLFHVYNPARRNTLHPDHVPLYPWPYVLHHMARNLAAAVKQIHEAGHVIGDLNESNILINRQAIVTLVDADSFQICEPGVQKQGMLSWLGATKQEIHRNGVGKPEFTPPELQGVDFKTVDRTPEHDNFALAVLIFYLLMEGHHPYAGVLHSRHSVGRVDLHCMHRGIFPYRMNLTASPPRGAPSLRLLHPDLQNAFVRAFVRGHRRPRQRPSAQEWLALLDQTADGLVPCPEERAHFYSAHLSHCPHCDPLVAKTWLEYEAMGKWWWALQQKSRVLFARICVWLAVFTTRSWKTVEVHVRERTGARPTHWLGKYGLRAKHRRRRLHLRLRSWDGFGDWTRRWQDLGGWLQWALAGWFGACAALGVGWGIHALAEFAELSIPTLLKLGGGAALVGLGSSLGPRRLLARKLHRYSKRARKRWLYSWVVGTVIAFTAGGLGGELLFDLSHRFNRGDREFILPFALLCGLLVGLTQAWWFNRHFRWAKDLRIWTLVSAVCWLFTSYAYLANPFGDALGEGSQKGPALLFIAFAHLCGTLLTGATFFWLTLGPGRTNTAWQYQLQHASQTQLSQRLKKVAIRWGNMLLLLALFSALLYTALNFSANSIH